MTQSPVCTIQLPGLSAGEVDTNKTPEAIGYASYWNLNDEDSHLSHEHYTIKIFSIFVVIATKLLLLGFCYEILQKLRKHKINRKTHEWYYYYWGAQVLIVCALVGVIVFERKKQHNKTALHIFFGSFGFDLSAFIVMLLIVTKLPTALIYCCCKGIFGDCCGCCDSKICCCGLCKIDRCSEYHNLDPSNRIAVPVSCNDDTSIEVRQPGRGTQLEMQSLRGERRQEQLQLNITLPEENDETSENSIIDECVPPPLSSLFQCCPFCCCYRRGIFSLNLYWFWCCPIIYYSSSDARKCCKCTLTSCYCFCTKCECGGCWWCSVCGIPCCTLLSSDNLRDSEDEPCYNAVCIQALKRCAKERESCSRTCSEWEKCGKCWYTCWTVLMNIISLVVFLAFVSYLSQALPAIVISYYLSPTASLIRLAFFEVVIIILLLEVAYLLFLIDKLTWLCYYNKHKKIPKEIEPEDDIDAESKGENTSDEGQTKGKHETYISSYIKENQKKLIHDNLCQCENFYLPCPTIRTTHCCYVENQLHTRECYKFKLATVYCATVPCCDEIKHWHCLFLFTIIQIFTMLLIIILSAFLLFFLLKVVIQQTSSPDNDFKVILTIVPTIALNLWLLFGQGNLGKAMKNIISKANKNADHDPLSVAEEGQIHHSASHHSVLHVLH